MSEINLNASQRSVIMELRDITKQTERTNERISTGKKVNSVADDAAAYFASKSLYNDAGTYLNIKDNVDKGISTLNVSLDALDAIYDLLDQMKGIVDSVSTMTNDDDKENATEAMVELGTQISYLTEDATFNGINILNSTASSLDIDLSPASDSNIEVLGYDFNKTSGSPSRALFGNIAYNSDLTFRGLSVLGNQIPSFVGAEPIELFAINASLDYAKTKIRQIASSFAGNVGVLETRLGFTENTANVYNEGGDKLTLADLDEEAALLTALQTSQDISIQSLAISGEMESNVLSLLINEE